MAPTVSKPLAGKRVLVTRAKHQASQFAAELEALGANVILVPAIEIAPPDSFAGLDGCIARLGDFDWLVFTSANGVRVFAERAGVCGLDLRQKTPHAAVAAIGPSTARAAEDAGLKVDLVPDQYVAEGLVEALRSSTKEMPGARVLVAGAKVTRDIVPDALRELGADVEVAEAYQTIVPQESVEALQSLLLGPADPLDAVTFTSSSTAKNFFALLAASGCSLAPEIAMASIGPITSQTLRELGREPNVEATEATVAGLALAIANYFNEP